MFVVKVPGINAPNEEKKERCKNSGDAIIKELRNIEINEQGKLVGVDLLDLEEIHLEDSDLKFSNELIFKNALKTFETKPKIVFLGGDHSISYSLNMAFLEYCKQNSKDPCLIIFDARPNCVSSENKGFPTYRGWLKSLVESGFPAENVFLVGIRNLKLEEMNFLKSKGIKFILTNSLLDNLQETSDGIMEFANGKELYVSVDVSIVDPAFAPSASYSESGGLTSRQLLYLIQRINKMKNLRAVDVVGINDEGDSGITVKLGAKILSELI